MTPDQVPKEAAAVFASLGINEYTASVYIVAMLKAWPKSRMGGLWDTHTGDLRWLPSIILPLQEARDDQ